MGKADMAAVLDSGRAAVQDAATPADLATVQRTTDLSELSFEQLMNVTTWEEVLGREIAEKDALVGVPLIITGVTFRQSDIAAREYVSLEAVTEKGDRVVINDGSTGIRDQMVKWAVGRGVFNDGALDREQPVRQFVDVELVERGGGTVGVNDDDMWSCHLPLSAPLRALRGLRRSEYGPSKDFDPVAKTGRSGGVTHYLA